jgi:hypothetical protein
MNSWTRKRCKLLVPRGGASALNMNELAHVVEHERMDVVKMAKQLLASSKRDGGDLSAAALVERLQRSVADSQEGGTESAGVTDADAERFGEPPIEDEVLGGVIKRLIHDAPMRLSPNETDDPEALGSWQDRTVDILADGLVQMLDESHKMQLLDRIMIKSQASPPRLNARKERNTHSGFPPNKPERTPEKMTKSATLAYLRTKAPNSGSQFAQSPLTRASTSSEKSTKGLNRRGRSRSSETFSSSSKKGASKGSRPLLKSKQQVRDKPLPAARTHPRLSKGSTVLSRNITFGGEDETWQRLSEHYNKIPTLDARIKYLKIAAGMSMQEKNEALELLTMVEDQYVETALRIVNMSLGFETSVEAIDAIKENSTNSDHDLWRACSEKSDEEFNRFINVLLLT